MGKSIRWTKMAIRQFHEAIEYIQQDSIQNAEKIRLQILTKVESLTKDTIVHRQDPLKKNNDGSFLYFETLRYRIVYWVMENEILIVRLRYTSREPKPY